ncbi:coiled-coil domain-containing protein 40-like [Uloborus diversus]|uniref:coiled-coil domain-containing protein 40-like n=1 Tax=Uloborus diversus TaxID=327109 RepID=UPI002409E980|nr:coiled-coil domain-containing protein 40-like [Uloborus diversus]
MKSYVLQKELKLQEEKMENCYMKHEEQMDLKQHLLHNSEDIRKEVRIIKNKHAEEIKRDSEFQKQLEDLAFEVVQLTSLQMETFSDAKNLKRVVEKTSRDKQQLELKKLRQDLLLSRLENERYNLEDKIHLYKRQWAIKREEINDLRKELNSANMEMQTIHFEKQQIVTQWKQSLSSLEKQDRILSEIRSSTNSYEDAIQNLRMEILAQKKAVRKELERNESLTSQLQFRDSDIARNHKNLSISEDRASHLEESLSVVEKIVEITENELNFLNDKKMVQEKELQNKEETFVKACQMQKHLEKMHMDMIHDKIVLTKTSRNTEKLIGDVRKSMLMLEQKGSKMEDEKEKLFLKRGDLSTHLSSLKDALSELQKETKEKYSVLIKSEAVLLKTRETIDSKHVECKALENELKELIEIAGGQERAPFEREIAHLRKEINLSDQGKREMEAEYIHFQRELFSIFKQNAVMHEENEMHRKKKLVMEGKKLQLEADIVKEEKYIKEVEKKKHSVERELVNINKFLHEKKKFEEALQQSTDLSRYDFFKKLKETEMYYLQRQSELGYLQKKKRKHFRRLIDLQAEIVYWEGKIHLAEDTKKVLESKTNLEDLSNLRSEIRRFNVKLEQIKKEQESLVKQMSRAVYRHTALFVEADKQALFGKRKKTSDYVLSRTKSNLKKLHENKKLLEDFRKESESLSATETNLNDSIDAENQIILDFMDKIKSYENNTDTKQQEKRQVLLQLSFKQKKTKLLQKVLDNTFVRAVRNETQRTIEVQKVQNALHALQVISQAAVKECPTLTKELSKIIDYVFVSKYI